MVRCCIRYMPWLRCIHILLASETQIQPWMKSLAETEGSPHVTFVFHRDFIPEEYLPCFTSPTIEMFLHRIPGLAEQFIYANDDMFVLRPLGEDDFFQDGVPCQRMTEYPFPDTPNLFKKKCLNQQNMIAAGFGLHFTGTWLRNGHSMQPVLLGTCHEVWRRHAHEITRNLSPARRTEHSYNQYIYPLYQHFSGRYVEHQPVLKYVGPCVRTEQIPAIIRHPKADIVCINDNPKISDWRQRSEIVKTAIAARLEGE